MSQQRDLQLHRGLPKRGFGRALRFSILLVATCLTACGGGDSETALRNVSDSSASNRVSVVSDVSDSASAGGRVNILALPRPELNAVAAAASIEEYKSHLAFVSSATESAASSPALLAQMSVMTDIVLTPGSENIDKDAVAKGFRDGMDAWRNWSRTAVATPMTHQAKMIDFLRTSLQGSLPRIPQHLSAAHSQLLSLPQSEGNLDTYYRTMLSERGYQIAEDFHYACSTSAKASELCDAAFRGNLQFSVKASYSTICQTASVGGCVALLSPPTTSTAVLNSVTVILAETRAKTSDCIKGLVGCKFADKDRSKEADGIKNAVKTISNLGVRLNLIGGRLGNEIVRVGGATSEIYLGSRKIADALSSLGTVKFDDVFTALGSWSSYKDIVFGENKGLLSNLYRVGESLAGGIAGIQGAVDSLLKLSGALGAGENINKELLAEIAELKKLITQMRQEMISRFDRVDAKLESIMLTMEDGLNAVNLRVTDVNTSVRQVQQAIAALDGELIRVSLSQQANLQALGRQDLNQITGLVQPISEERFRLELSLLYNYIQNSTVDVLRAGPTRPDFAVALKNEFVQPVSQVLNALCQYPRIVLGRSTTLCAQRLANVAELLYAANLYAQLTEKYPSYLKNSVTNKVVQEQVDGILRLRVQPIADFILLLQQQPDLFSNWSADYRARAVSLTNAIKSSIPLVLRAQSTLGTGLDTIGLDIFGAPTQQTSYIPTVVRLNKIVPCTGTGPSLSFPENWQALFGSSSPATYEALNAGALSACYELDPQGSGGWTNLELLKIKPDRYWAWGVLTVSIKTFAGGKPVMTRKLSLPREGASARESICFYFATSNISAAPGAVPASSVLAQAWEGTFQQPVDWCGGFYAPSNIRKVFTQNSTVIFDWSTGATPAKVVADATIQAALSTLQKSLYAYVSQEVYGVGEIAQTTKQLGGAKLALQRYIELGYPGSVVDNMLLRSLLVGSDALPDDDGVAEFFDAASRGQGQSPIAGLVGGIDVKIARLTTILDAESARLKSGAVSQLLPELAILQTRLSTLQGFLAYKARTDTARLFDLAQSKYPSLFSGTASTAVYDKYTYRFYSSTGTYLGFTTDKRVVVHGSGYNFQDVGGFDDYLPLAEQAGF